MLYLPVLYYPTKKDDRATGFLIPTYGSSTLRGQSLHNAFFWAINRSQDATFMHDWYLEDRPGRRQRVPLQLRRRRRQLPRHTCSNEHDADVRAARTAPSRRRRPAAATSSAAAPTSCCRAICARAASVNYFSSIVADRRPFNTNIYDASRNQRSFGGNVVGAWGSYSLNATIDHTRVLLERDGTRALSGSWPRVSVDAQRAADPGHAAVLLGRQRVRAACCRTAQDTSNGVERQPGRRAASTSRRRSGIRSRSGSGSRSTPRSAGATRTTRAACGDRRSD